MRWLKILFTKERPKQVPLEERVSVFLSRLQPCGQKILIAGPAYGDGIFRAEIVAPTQLMILWADMQSQTKDVIRFGSSAVIFAALPKWLKNFDPLISSPTVMPQSIYEEVGRFAPDLIRSGIATVRCPDCRQCVSVVKEDTGEPEMSGAWMRWTDRWRCPQGHLLYENNFETHLKFAD